MRNQQRWLISLLGLGILVFTQIAADSYDVARLARDVGNGDVSNVNERIIKRSSSLKLSDRNIAPLQMIYGVRSLVISCIDMLRKKSEAEDRGIVSSIISRVDAISECDSASQLATSLINFLKVYIGVDDIDPSYLATLEKDSIRKILMKTMRFYENQKYLKHFVQKKIKDGILTRKIDPKDLYAWNMVRKWNDTSIKDVNLRFMKLFVFNKEFVNVRCPLNDIESLKTDSPATEDCRNDVLDGLLIMSSAICKDGLSLQAAFYEHPILTNYLYIVDQVLLDVMPACIPVKKSVTIPLVDCRPTI